MGISRLLSICVLALISASGCFQNLSTNTSSLLSTRSGSGFVDTGGTSLNGKFNGKNLELDTQAGGIVGSFKAEGTPENSMGQIGLMINLQPILLRSIDPATLNDLLNDVDSNDSIQNIQVTLRIPQFDIQAVFPFRVISQNNSKRLRNVMVIRPNLAGVDFQTGYLPERSTLRSIGDGRILGYGGVIEDIALNQISVFTRDVRNGATSFLPGPSNTNWGRNLTDPVKKAIVRTMTPELARIYKALRTQNNVFDENFKDFAAIDLTPESFLLAVHLNDAQEVERAWVIGTSFTDSILPPTDILCSKNMNSMTKTAIDPNSGKRYAVAHGRACSCEEMQDEYGNPSYSPYVFETCKKGQIQATGPLYAAEKLPFIHAAISASAYVAPPDTGSFPYKTVTSNGVTLSPLLPF